MTSNLDNAFNNDYESQFASLLKVIGYTSTTRGKWLLRFGLMSFGERIELIEELLKVSHSKLEMRSVLSEMERYLEYKEDMLNSEVAEVTIKNDSFTYNTKDQSYNRREVHDIDVETGAPKKYLEVQTKSDNRPKKHNYPALDKFNSMTGLEKVKEQVKELLAKHEIDRLREQNGLKTKGQSLHMMFKGNPGTGKTTVARLLGEIFKEIGILSKGHLVEIDRSNLVSKYQGEPEKFITQYVEAAKGGILLIDEIYALGTTISDMDVQGDNIINVLIKLVEDNREDFICVGTGYTKEVNNLIKRNPGFASRFSLHIDFEDYNDEQLLEIASKMLEEQDYTFKEDFEQKFMECVKKEKDKENFGNARVVRNIIEDSIREQSMRLYNSNEELDKEKLMTILGEDVKYEPVEST